MYSFLVYVLLGFCSRMYVGICIPISVCLIENYAYINDRILLLVNIGTLEMTS